MVLEPASEASEREKSLVRASVLRLLSVLTSLPDRDSTNEAIRGRVE